MLKDRGRLARGQLRYFNWGLDLANDSILRLNLFLVQPLVDIGLMVGTRGSRMLSTKADMFSLGMVIHFMAFRGKLPYIATGETLESLDELRREVQAFPG